MKILNIELKNFKPFTDLQLPEQGELPEGLILVRGPNSTGKSSLFEAILWALWGPEAIELTNDEIISFSSSYCKVVLSFDVDGSIYKIDRTYDAANGMAVVLYARTGKAWKRIADKSATVKKSIEDILGIQWTQAQHTLLVRQGEVALIANATPSVLRDLLVRVYNIELLEKMAEQVEYFESDLAARLKTLTNQYQPPEMIQEQIAQTKRRIGNYEGDIAKKSKTMEKNRKDLTRFPSSESLLKIKDLSKGEELSKRDYDRLLEEVDRALKKAGILEAGEKVIHARREYLAREEEEIKSTQTTSELRRAEIDQAIGSIDGISKDLETKTRALESVKSQSGEETVPCPTCAKPLTSDERSRIVREYRESIEKNRQDRQRLASEKSKLASDAREATDRMSLASKALDALTLVEERQALASQAKRLLEEHTEHLREEVRALGFESIPALLKSCHARDLSEVLASVDALNRENTRLADDLESLQRSIDGENQLVSSLESKIVQMKDIGAQIDTIKTLDLHAKYVRRNLVRGFVADWVFQKRLIGIIRGATNQYVKAFTGGQYTGVDLEPTPAKGKSGPGLILKIRDERDHATKKTSQLSYGDRTAISLSLRLGISRTMSGVRPFRGSPAVSPKVRCVLLDEPLSGLDRNRRVAVVKNLVSDQSFKQIFLITHTEVQGSEGVPVIDVSKTGTASSAVLHLTPDE